MSKPTKAERRDDARIAKRKAPTRVTKPLCNSSRSATEEAYRVKSKTIELTPKNAKQAEYIDALYDEGRDILFAVGPAGTGKTYLPSLYALRELKDGGYKRIIITRPVVPNGEDLGYLPGDLIEKLGPWVRPVLDTFQEVMDKSEVESLLAKGTLELAPLGLMRGRTFKNALVICDEAQNTTKEQMKMLLTRIGEGSRMIVTGDLEQRDRIDGECGLQFFLDELRRSTRSRQQRFAVIEFEKKDVERHPVISDVLNIFGD